MIYVYWVCLVVGMLIVISGVGQFFIKKNYLIDDSRIDERYIRKVNVIDAIISIILGVGLLLQGLSDLKYFSEVFFYVGSIAFLIGIVFEIILFVLIIKKYRKK